MKRSESHKLIVNFLQIEHTIMTLKEIKSKVTICHYKDTDDKLIYDYHQLKFQVFKIIHIQENLQCPKILQLL